MSKRVLVLCQRKAGLKYFKQADVDLIKELIKTLFDKDKDNIKIEYMTPGLCDGSDKADDMDYKMEFGDLSGGFIDFLYKNKKKYDAIVLGFCPVAFSYFKSKKFIGFLFFSCCPVAFVMNYEVKCIFVLLGSFYEIFPFFFHFS